MFELQKGITMPDGFVRWTTFGDYKTQEEAIEAFHKVKPPNANFWRIIETRIVWSSK